MEAAEGEARERAKALFARALEGAPERRRAVVDAARDCDAALRADVWSLLTSDAEAGAFLDQPAAALLAGGITDGPARVLALGDCLGRYEVESFLGAGAVSEVYRARDTRLGRIVALKVLNDPTAPDAGAWLLREAQHASTLNHPHVCAVHEIEEADACPFIVLELIEGITLFEAVKQGPRPVSTIVRWGAEIADALAHAHGRGVVHRDLKGSNVLVTPEQHVKVLDFGLARRLEAGTGPGAAASVLADASVAGTLTHIAPEVLNGEPADARVDIWALGVMLYELASGSAPFAGATPFATAHAIVENAPAPLPATVPPGLRQIVGRCLSKDPQARYGSAAEVRDALEGLERDLASTSRRRRAPRRRLVAAVVAAALLTAAYVGRGAMGRVRSRAAPPSAPVLAVLPFLEPGADESQRYLADGVTEGLVAELGRIDGIRVIAPASAGPFRRRPDAIPAVGRETGAGQVLTGSVTRIGDRVRLTVRLLQPSSGREIWASDYERHQRQLPSLYGTVAAGVAAAVEVELGAEDADRLSRTRAVDPDVYEAYLKGRYHWGQRTAESLHTAVAHYGTAVRLDPSYAPAYAGLADCYNQLGTQMLGGGSPREWRPRAREAAIRALQIDPALAEAHATLGYVRHYDWEWEAAEQSFRRAIALNPSNPLARIWYANLLSGRRRVDEALVQVNAASELDPLSPVVGTNQAWVLSNARRYAEAIAVLEAIVARDPSYVQAHARLAGTYAFAGRLAESVAAAETANRLAGGSPATRAGLAQALALAGRRQEAVRLLDGLLAERARQYVPPGAIANVYVALGHMDQALRWLDQSHAERANNNAYLAVEPIFDSLRPHPRFQALLRATGLQ
jgi:serine/threonine-protein kinase